MVAFNREDKEQELRIVSSKELLKLLLNKEGNNFIFDTMIELYAEKLSNCKNEKYKEMLIKGIINILRIARADIIEGTIFYLEAINEDKN